MKHNCLRCCLESSCGDGSWADRHPVAAVLGGVPSVLFRLAAIGAYPWVFIPLLVLGGLAYTVDRERRRRQALAARADWEHHALMVAAVAPLKPNSVPRRRRGADHWSETEPLRHYCG